MDVDAEARGMLDRMATDFAQMVKRADVDYYLKSPAIGQSGNDQLAFYSTVSGYSSGTTGSVSLVAYRINAQQRLERMAKGLLWNGSSSTSTPVVFLPLTISATWATATDATADTDYELVAPSVFRFEYYYQLKTGALSLTPWDTVASHTSVVGMQDVAAISVSIAAIDPTSRVLVSDAQLTSLGASMNDFAVTMKPGELLAQWQTAVNATTGVPRPSLSAIRFYERRFHLLPKL